MLKLKPVQVARALTHKLLRLTILPIEDCILSCTYCYEDHVGENRAIYKLKQAISDNKRFRVAANDELTQLELEYNVRNRSATFKPMSRSTINGIKNLLTTRKKKGLEVLYLSWFGGEPLMEIAIIKEIHEHANSLNLKVIANATTNYVPVTSKVLAKLCAFGLNRFQVSLDGSQQDHDQTRISVSGKGTYKRIMSNLIQARETDLDFNIGLRIHSHPGNYPRMPDFLREISETFLHDKRFSVDLHAVGDYGGDAVKDMDIFNATEQAKMIEDIKQYVKYSYHKPILSEEEAEPYVCYACHPNFFVIRASGDIAKCTVSLKKIGTLAENGQLDIDGEKHKFFLRGWNDFNPANVNLKQLECAYSK